MRKSCDWHKARASSECRLAEEGAERRLSRAVFALELRLFLRLQAPDGCRDRHEAAAAILASKTAGYNRPAGKT